MSSFRTDECRRADRARRCYTFERTMAARQLNNQATYQLPECWGDGGGSDVWLKLVRLCRHQDVDPERYIRWSLEIRHYYPGVPPEPNELAWRERMAAYTAELRALPRWLRVRFEIGIRSLNTKAVVSHSVGASWDDAWAHAITNRSIDVSPLARYLSAKRQSADRFWRIALSYRNGALLQYHAYADEYDEILGELWIPTGFRKQAALLYDELLGYRVPQPVGGSYGRA